jgi:hypothetical protein
MPPRRGRRRWSRKHFAALEGRTNQNITWVVAEEQGEAIEDPLMHYKVSYIRTRNEGTPRSTTDYSERIANITKEAREKTGALKVTRHT